MQLSLGVSQGGGLLLNGLGVRGALGLAVGNQLLIVLLTVLLRKLGLLNLLLQIIDHHIHKANHTTRVRLLEGANLWCWGRGGKAVRTDLDKRVCLLDLLLLRKLLRLRLLVLLGVVELVQSVFSKLQKLKRSTVLRSRLHVLHMLCLALFSGLRHGLVQRLDAGVQFLNLLLETLDSLLRGCNVRILITELVLQCLVLVLGGSDLIFAITELGIVIGLFHLQTIQHLIDLLHDLVKPALLPLESQSKQVQLGVSVPARRSPQSAQRPAAQLALGL
mmetsp:Transcript_58855/g.126702  ORF Transcript_58855/g.126702 Transcript_58855/m.126702 type:complete len:276 (+) Transcript_58855:337-1164(+)